MTSIQYDPTLIQVYASRLYQRAAQMQLTGVIAGLIVGAIPGYWLAHLTGSFGPMAVIAPCFAGLGFLLARERAFVLRLEAQRALCQVQIAASTRRMAELLDRGHVTTAR